jgi:chitin synthase
VEGNSVVSQFSKSFDQLLDGLNSTNVWFIFFVKPNNKLSPDSFDAEVVSRQLKSHAIQELVQLRKAGYLYHFKFDDFAHDFQVVFQTMGIKDSSPSKKITALFKNLNLKQNESFAMGKSKLFLKQSGWEQVMDAFMREKEKSGLTSFTPSGFYYRDERFSEDGSDHSATTEFTIASKNMFRSNPDIETGAAARKSSKGAKKAIKQSEPAASVPLSSQRRRWLKFTKFCTWWIPESFIRSLGKRNPDVVQAWKEKVALCCIIFFLSSNL